MRTDAILLNWQKSYANSMPKHSHLSGKRLQVTAKQRRQTIGPVSSGTGIKPAHPRDINAGVCTQTGLTKFVSFSPKIDREGVTIFVPYGNTPDHESNLLKLFQQSDSKHQPHLSIANYCHLASSLL